MLMKTSCKFHSQTVLERIAKGEIVLQTRNFCILVLNNPCKEEISHFHNLLASFICAKIYYSVVLDCVVFYVFPTQHRKVHMYME